ncbi:MAG: acyl carrier protein [Candidatus Methylumidiphilus alinenensis]|uniref:Acyl carrier protein n=1 Tax=Candidatus Methylumidiphilus alinenensis TaxID=2202197 RepID=A0A2W4TJD3_9GAMM|nr:MAG: acyl carrier protein [Candidatus Methylumidiphilus alinenensis]
MENIEAELKQLIIDTLELEGISSADILSEAPLFGEGLGLDSIDALELGVALKKKYKIHIDTDSAELVNYFASVNNLAGFVISQQKKNTL